MQADFSAIDTALSMYRLNNFTYPTSEQGLEALVDKPTIDPIPSNWKKVMHPIVKLHKYLATIFLYGVRPVIFIEKK